MRRCLDCLLSPSVVFVKRYMPPSLFSPLPILVSHSLMYTSISLTLLSTLRGQIRRHILKMISLDMESTRRILYHTIHSKSLLKKKCLNSAAPLDVDLENAHQGMVLLRLNNCRTMDIGLMVLEQPELYTW